MIGSLAWFLVDLVGPDHNSPHHSALPCEGEFPAVARRDSKSETAEPIFEFLFNRHLIFKNDILIFIKNVSSSAQPSWSRAQNTIVALSQFSSLAYP